MLCSTPCPVCGSLQSRFSLENEDFLFRTTHKTFQMYRCRECGTGFLCPQPSAEELRAAYPTPYWWVIGQRRSSLLGRLEEFYREIVLRHHVRVARRCFSCPQPRVLDIGAGSGTFLHVLRRMTGIQGEGLDVSADAARAARDLYGITVHPLDIAEAGFPPDAFDLITMFHVLEHLPRPREALLKILSWLAPEGVLLVQVPNLNSYQARLFGPRWIGIDIPRHLVNFTPAGLRRLLEGTGFSPGAASFYSLRDNAPAIVSSLAPSLDPVAMAIRGNTRFASARRLFYFGLVLLAQPLALLESLLGKGGTMFLVAKKES